MHVRHELEEIPLSPWQHLQRIVPAQDGSGGGLKYTATSRGVYRVDVMRANATRSAAAIATEAATGTLL
jgi:hypothetical protein